MQNWGNLPPELIAAIFGKLEGADCWFAWQLSRRWATVAREVASFETTCHVPLKSAVLVSKLKSLSHWRQLHGLHKLTFLFQLGTPDDTFSVAAVTEYLGKLTSVKVCGLCLNLILSLNVSLCVNMMSFVASQHAQPIWHG